MPEYEDHEFSPKVCGQIHKRVDEKIARLEADVNRLRDTDIPNTQKIILDKMSECESRMNERFRHADEVANSTINQIGDSVRDGVSSATKGINALRELIEKVDDKIPENHKVEHELDKNIRNRIYWTVAICSVIAVAFAPQIFIFVKAVISHLASFTPPTHGGAP